MNLSKGRKLRTCFLTYIDPKCNCLNCLNHESAMKPVECRDEIIHVSNKQMTRLYDIVNEDIGVSYPREIAYTKMNLYTSMN